ncbi:MAG: flagellar basal body P-ring formation protein FlgA [Gammaproteobacteria bacterium]|nr:flagellar basal body P-ring formation protein FlgA [Gammaproteobacteria bacterium]
MIYHSVVLAEAASGTNKESHEAIRAIAAEFARQQIDDPSLSDIQVKASKLDPRLNLVSCDKPLEAFSTGNSRQLARTTVGVKCTGEKPWTLYVPITVEATANVVYTSKPLLRGEALAPDALELRKVPLAKLPVNHLGDTAQLTGMAAARPLRAGVPVTLNAVKPRQLIKQGQQVVILASSGGIQVRMTGVAKRNGSRGELIPVENRSSGRTVEAMVLDAGTVRVNF